MKDEINKLRDEIEYYKENDNRYIFTTSKSGDTIRKFIKYDDHMMRILSLEIEEYAKLFEVEDDEKNIVTYMLLEIYALIKYPVLLDFNKFIKYLDSKRKIIEENDELMAKLAICYKLLDSNRIIDKKDILSFLSEGFKNFAENDNKSDIYVKLATKEEVIKIVEDDEVIDEIDTVLRYMIYVENEKNATYKKEKLNLKRLEADEKKTLVL